MYKLICTFVFAQIICLTFSKDLPPDFKKCKRDDDMNGCLKKSVQEALHIVENGLPAFKLPAMEPLRIESMIIGAGTGPVQVIQKFKDVDLYNLTKVTFTDAKAKVTDTELVLEFDVMQELITLKAKYELNGRILVLPIVGEGSCVIELHDVKANLIFTGEPVERNGKKYMKIGDIKVNLVPKNVTYNFENLFNGDKQLGDAMNKVLNDNDLLVFLDVQSGYEEFLSVVIRDVANKIFEHVPYKDLFPV